jgi:hypothetical protein
MKKVFLLVILSLLFLSGCKKVTYNNDGIGRFIETEKINGYGKLTISQTIDTAHFFTDNDIIKTEIWLGDKDSPFVFSFGSILKEANSAEKDKALEDEYNNAYNQAKVIRQKLINGGMIIVGDDSSIDDENSWITNHKTTDVSSDFAN